MVAALLRLGPLCLSFALCAQAAPRSSTAYTIPAEVLNSAGPRATSTAYSHDGDLDMLGTSAGSASYTLGSGFRDAAQDSTAPTITLPASPFVATATSASGAAVTFSVTASDDEDGTLTPTLSAISGAVFPPGDTLVIVSATDSTGNTAGGSFVVRVMSVASSWAAANGVSSNLNLPGANGVNNLLNFAFGVHPVTGGPGTLQYTGTLAGGGTISAAGQPLTLKNGADIRALFIRRKDYVAAGLTYTPRFSPNLTTWTDSTTTPTVLADDGTNQIVSVPYPPLAGGFFQLRVSVAP